MDNQLSTGAINACGLRGLSRSSSLKNSFRRHREPVWITNIRQQLTEQLKCLDFRLEMQLHLLHELQDFYKRRAEVESEYGRNMEKLVKQTMTRHRNEKQKRESWPDYSTYTVWQTLLSTTHKLGGDHEKLSEIYSSQMALQLQHLSEFIQGAYKRCREIIVLSHEEIVRVLTELQASVKTYQKYHGEFVQAETKLKTVEGEQKRLNVAMEKPNVILRRKLRNLEKQLEKKQLKFLESNLKAVKARNEYLLCLEAANSSIQKYFTDNINELIDATDFGYHDTLSHVMHFHTSAEDCVISSQKGCLDLINQQIQCLSELADKQSFLERFNGPFAMPQRFQFQPHLGDKVCHLSVEDTAHDDILDRMGAIRERLRTLISDSDEVLEAIQRTTVTFLSNIKDRHIDLVTLFQDGKRECQESVLDQVKSQSEKLEAEETYFSKVREYQSTSNLIARLQAKYNYIEKAFNENSNITFKSASMSSIITKKREMKQTPLAVRPQLFGGLLEEYIRLSGEEIPQVIRSSVQVINLFGMHHQGIFRIPGSQKEINEYRNQFEKGKDPFVDKMDSKGIDSVAGVLKLYFRELREPLFPSALFEELASFINNRSFTDPSEVARSIYDLRHLLMSSIEPPVIIVMRYFFSFLNHLSEFSDENMMDPLNLAICLGPTLLPVPSDHDLVQYQGHVTELIKNIIIFQEDIFPRTTDGSVYEKCIIQVHLGIKSESKTSLFEDGYVLEDFDSEDETVTREAVALYEFQSRTDRELSFKKGDSITILEKVSADWWEAVVNGRGGLIPDKYFAFQPHDISMNNEWRSNIENQLNAIESSQVSHQQELAINIDRGSFEDIRKPTSSSDANQSACIGDGGPCFLTTSNPNLAMNAIQSHENQENVIKPDPLSAATFTESDKMKTTEELKNDIDAALADVFSGIRYLSGTSGNHDSKQILSDSEDKHQPDLVNDLPASFPQPNVAGDEFVRVRMKKTNFKRPISCGNISHEALPLLKNKPYSNFQSGWTAKYKEPVIGSTSDDKVLGRPSATHKSHQNIKAPYRACASENGQHSSSSKHKPEFAKSHGKWQQSEFYANQVHRADKSSKAMAAHQESQFRANEQDATGKNLVSPVSPAVSSHLQQSDIKHSRKGSTTQSITVHLVRKSQSPTNADQDMSEYKLTDRDDYTPSFI